MKKHSLLLALLILMQTSFCLAALSSKCIGTMNPPQQDSLKQYTGKYQMQQGMQTIYMEVYIEDGKLAGKNLATGEIKILDHLAGDAFILSKEKLPIKFIRDKDNKVSGIAILGNVMWTKVDDKSTTTSGKNPADPKDYLGKYQITANGQTLVIEISLKNGQLVATQLWDGANSTLDFVSGDSFIVNALSMPIKFIRDDNKIVIQLILNGADKFTKVKS